MLFVLEPRHQDDARLEVLLTEAALERFACYRQFRWWQREAGGQLFAAIDGERWTIVEATGPRRCDKRSRFGFYPNRIAEQDEIKDQFAKGLHYVGDWHTHPEPTPHPSPADEASMAEMVRRSDFQTSGLLMLVVGTQPPPLGLYLSVHRRGESWQRMDAASVARGAQLPAVGG